MEEKERRPNDEEIGAVKIKEKYVDWERVSCTLL